MPAVVIALLTETSRPRWTWLLASLVTGVLHIAYGMVLQRGYDVGELSVVYPVARGVGPLLSIMLAVVLLGERPGPIGLLGAALIIAGVLIIGTGRVAATRGAVKAGIVYGVATGAVIAAYTLWDAYSVTTLDVPPVIYFGTAAVMQSVISHLRLLGTAASSSSSGGKIAARC
ncbi:EamA family transporter [Kribbella sp. NBC_01245]|uniref:EamA family transporter n=1 Tax=Kribbella sp. NBC_01245 TaxID=2903578 RepID=UPI002E2979B8|nr:EamA family transporter [Kribbella sp. NBC_01245]